MNQKTRFLVFSFAVLSIIWLASASSWAESRTTGRSEGNPAPIQITSPAFSEGAPIPAKYTCDGQDLSPPLRWGGVPQGAKSLTLICEDPDAPVGIWVHWLLYDLPPSITELPQGIPPKKIVLRGAKQGKNDFGRLGYGGPCPPRGSPHRYFFRVFALDAELPLSPGLSKRDLLQAMEGHILAEGALMGIYQRK